MGRFSVFTKNCLMDFFVFIMDVVNELGGGWASSRILPYYPRVLAPAADAAPAAMRAAPAKVRQHHLLRCRVATPTAALQHQLKSCSTCCRAEASAGELGPLLQRYSTSCKDMDMHNQLQKWALRVFLRISVTGGNKNRWKLHGNERINAAPATAGKYQLQRYSTCSIDTAQGAKMSHRQQRCIISWRDAAQAEDM